MKKIKLKPTEQVTEEVNAKLVNKFGADKVVRVYSEDVLDSEKRLHPCLTMAVSNYPFDVEEFAQRIDLLNVDGTHIYYYKSYETLFIDPSGEYEVGAPDPLTYEPMPDVMVKCSKGFYVSFGLF